MRLKLVCMAIGGSLAAGVTANATVVEGPIADPYSGANLYIVSSGAWSDAQTQAIALGGNLVTIHSAAEDNFIATSVLTDYTSSGGPNLSNVPVWIGLYDPTGTLTNDGSGAGHAADFVWVDGENSSYRNWNSQEPNNNGGTEYYTAINWYTAEGASGDVGDWNDTPLGGTSGFGGNTNGPYYGLVEVPEPATVGLVLIAGAGAAGRLGRSRSKRRSGGKLVATRARSAARVRRHG